MNAKKWFNASMVAFLLFGLAMSPVLAQDSGQVNEEQVQKEIEKQQKEIEKQQKSIEKQTLEIERKMEKSLKHLDKISRLDALHGLRHLQSFQIPAVPPVPAVQMPDMMNPKKMLEEFKGEKVSKKESKTFAANADSLLVVESSFSSVHISPASSESSITVNVERLGGGSTTAIAEQMADRFTVSMREEGNQVIVEVKLDGKEGQSGDHTLMHCFLNILVPASTPIDVSNEFGGVRYEGLEDSIDSNNKFGSTSILNTKGSLDINSSYGSLTIDGHEGDADLNSEFGSSNIKNIKGTLDFNNSYGSSEVSLSGNESQADINFSFGNGTVHLSKTFSGSIDTNSSFGNIIIAGNTISGKLEGEMQGSKESAGVTLKNVKAEKDMFNQSIECTIGGEDGEGSVDINADYSTVYIHFDL